MGAIALREASHPPGDSLRPAAGRPPGFVLLVLAHGLKGERVVAYLKEEADVRILRDITRGPMQLGGYASREDPVLLDLVSRFEAGEALPVRRAA